MASVAYAILSDCRLFARIDLARVPSRYGNLGAMDRIRPSDDAGSRCHDLQQADGLLLDASQKSRSYNLYHRRMAGSDSLRIESITSAQQTVVGASVA